MQILVTVEQIYALFGKCVFSLLRENRFWLAAECLISETANKLEPELPYHKLYVISDPPFIRAEHVQKHPLVKVEVIYI